MTTPPVNEGQNYETTSSYSQVTDTYLHYVGINVRCLIVSFLNTVIFS